MYCFFNIVLIIHYIYQNCYYNSEILCHKLNLLKIYLYVVHVISTEFKIYWYYKKMTVIGWHLLYIGWHILYIVCTSLYILFTSTVPRCTLLYNSTEQHCTPLLTSTVSDCTPLCRALITTVPQCALLNHF